jgi:hypothetical protein
VVVVDPIGDFQWLEESLQSSSSPYPVMAFDSVRAFEENIAAQQKTCPKAWLIVIADTAARYQGAFDIGRKLVKNFCGIAYTTDTAAPEWDTQHPKHIVSRSKPDSVSDLRGFVNKTIQELAGLEDRTPPPKREPATTQKPSGESRMDPELPLKLDPNNQQKTDAPSMENLSLDDLVKPGTFLSRMLQKKELGKLGRFILRETLWNLFTRLSHKSPTHLKKYQSFVKTAACSKDQRGLRILTEVLEQFFESYKEVEGKT